MSVSIDLYDSSNMSSGMERLTSPIFFKKFNYFRPSQVNTRFSQYPNDIQLPMGSMLHLLDNFENLNLNKPIVDVPDFNNPNSIGSLFIKNEPFRKYICHNVEPLVKGENAVIEVDDKYVFRTMGLNQTLMKYRREQSLKGFLFTPDIENHQKAPTTLTIVNHNPIFRLFTRGVLTAYRNFNLILASILNTIAKVPDKNHYVVLPLVNKIYTRDMFRMSEKELKGNTLKDRNSYQYLFMVQWFNFISTNTNLSLFEKFPQEMWDKVTFVFNVPNNYAMFWTLSDVISVNVRNALYNRLLNQFNAFILTGYISEHGNKSKNDALETLDKLSQHEETPSIDLAIKDNLETQTETAQVKADIKPESSQDASVSVQKELAINKPAEIDNPKKEKDKDDYTEKVIVDIFNSSANKNKAPDTKDVDNSINAEEVTPDQLVTEETVTQNQIEEFDKPIEEIKADTSTGLPTNVTPFKTPEKISAVNKSFLAGLVRDTKRFIEDNQQLTAKQKDRCLHLAGKIDTIQINGQSISNIITSRANPNIDEQTVDVLKDYVPDKSMLNSKIVSMDKAYMNTYFLKDMLSIGTSFSRHGMFLTGIEETKTFTELTRIRTFKFSYEDYKAKKHTIKFSVPDLAEDGTCLVNGVRTYLKKQFVNVPICKVSETRVSLASNYNKTIIERNTAKAHSFAQYFKRYIELLNKEKIQVQVQYGNSHNSSELRLPYEYCEISKWFTRITFNNDNNEAGNTEWLFEYKNRFIGANESTKKKLEDLEKHFGIYIGKRISGDPALFFMDINNKITVVDPRTFKRKEITTIMNHLYKRFKVQLSGSQLTEWTDIKILDKKFPIGFILCYKFGITRVLEMLDCKYRIESNETNRRRKTDMSSTMEVAIKFEDKTLYIPRYPLRNSLIMAGLTFFDTSVYKYEDLNFSDIYYTMLKDKGNGFKINYLKGIDDTFKLFIDPITFRILKQMNEPTTMEGLLIRATDMLTTLQHKEASSLANFRLRSYERLNAILYNEMGRQFAAYGRRQGAGNTFSINPNAVIQRILLDQAMINVEDINPVHDIKTFSTATYTGVGGRTSESFTTNDRRYPKDGIGTISEATPDSGAVGITATLSMDPAVANVDGFIETPESRGYQYDPTNILSVANVLMPCTTQDDSLYSSSILYC